MKKKFIGFSLVVLSLGAFFVGTYYHMKSTEAQQNYVDLSKETDKIVVFYREDCPDCQSVFPSLYYHNLVYQDLVFVNMNNQKNRQYIVSYNLKSVPTFSKDNDSYSGTNKSKIAQFVKSH